MDKIEKGQFFTTRNVFKDNSVFVEFMNSYNLWDKKLLEPFAGSNLLIKFIKEYNPNIKYNSFDIEPQNEEVQQNDSINNWFYKGYDFIITNPPYLSKHSAKRMRIKINNFQEFDDLYKVSLWKCIENIRFTIAIIPATLINSNRKADQKIINKLVAFQLIPNKDNFNDTEHPVAIAYFDNEKENKDFLLYESNVFIKSFCNLKEMEEKILYKKNSWMVTFNTDVNHNLSVVCCDNTRDTNNIGFKNNSYLSNIKSKSTDRHKVKISVLSNVDKNLIRKLNDKIKELRENNCDYLWATFKGVSKINKYRRRIDFKTLRKIINSI
ncbi:Uncharacterised protein [Mycoplasmopsis citelli]|uniref:Type II methyltransferase M.TaqI-like domain-containing protein n=1 Tax=Mycoplasmopsis citelli TaxID=171281 RepID=A0A449B299_9BACT|nr:hypothetical protein [Mycoplasmopsis citelli]VEU74720.1 Uncharacterised protein [Mycoplasmopsis citelli]